jgi:hypothetical protein
VANNHGGFSSLTTDHKNINFSYNDDDKSTKSPPPLNNCKSLREHLRAINYHSDGINLRMNEDILTIPGSLISITRNSGISPSKGSRIILYSGILAENKKISFHDVHVP